MKNYALISICCVFALSSLLLFCTEVVEPTFYAPSIQNNKTISTIGKRVVDSTFSMFISVKGTPQFTFQWYKDGTPISRRSDDLVGDTLRFERLSLLDKGVYSCIATNSLGSDTSTNCSLTVYSQPVIVTQPQSINLFAGDSATLSILATGNELIYQWMKNSVKIDTAIDTFFNVPPVVKADSGTAYTCVVSNGANTVTSQSAIIHVLPTYTVTYDGNGNTSGEVPTDANKYKIGSTVIVIGNTGSLAKSGFSFDGWNTKADGTGVQYPPGATFVMGQTDITLYAKWKASATFSVTYNGNTNTSGRAPIDSNAYITGATVTVLGNTGGLAKTGFTFVGWNTKIDGTGVGYVPGKTFPMGTSDITLYAQWTNIQTYKVIYNGNTNTGGDVPVDDNNYVKGATVTVMGNTGNLIKTGFNFTGWNTKVDGTGTIRNPGETFTMDTAAVTLYAQWTSSPTYSVTYNGNTNTGGNAPEDGKVYLVGALVTVLGNNGNLTKTDYTFSGWNTKADGTGTTYQPTKTFPMPAANVTLYALWTKTPTFSVTYNGNASTSGSAPTDVNKYKTGDSVIVLGNTGNLTKTGFTFTGWNTKADGSGTTHQVGTKFEMGSADVLLFAKWTNQKTYTVTYHKNAATSGTPPIDDNRYKYRDTISILHNSGSLRKEGFDFKGWNSKQDGSGNHYGVFEEYLMDSADLNLYAEWKNKTYEVYFTADTNGSIEGVSPQTIKHGENCSPVTAVPDVNHHFFEWTGDYNGTENPLNITNVNSHLTIWAHFNVDIAKIVSSGSHSMILAMDSTLWTVGYNGYGQLGIGNTSSRKFPTFVQKDVIEIIAGGTHTLFIMKDQSLWASGKNDHGQLGDETNVNKSVPVKIMDNVLTAACGSFFTMILKTDNTLWGTGGNGWGQLGDSTTTDKNKPIFITDSVLNIACGYGFTLIRKMDNTLWAMGRNRDGQFGDSLPQSSEIPIYIMNNIRDIAAGQNFSLFLKTDRSVWGSGKNDFGQLGDGTLSTRYKPVKIMTNISKISAGQDHSLLLTQENALWVIGKNQEGQLGDSTYSGKDKPYHLMDNIIDISGGGRHSLFLTTDRKLFATGANNSGQLGIGHINGTNIPTQVIIRRDMDHSK